MMLKRLSTLVLVVVLLAVTGCSFGDSPAATTTKAADVDVVKQSVIGNLWAVKQMRINLNSDIPLLLTLSPGDKVDGYFYLEKGNNIDFKITGKTLIYQSTVQSAGSANITSDRFTFSASDAQGLAYTLTFSPSVKATDKNPVTPVVFLELIFPKTGGLFNPMSNN